MIKTCTLIFTLSLFSLSTVSAPAQYENRENGNNIKACHTTVAHRIQSDEFFTIEIKHYNEQVCGAGINKSRYETVNELDTSFDRLPGGREGLMVLLHQRWRGLPDVPVLVEGLRNYGGCKDVFKF